MGVTDISLVCSDTNIFTAVPLVGMCHPQKCAHVSQNLTLSHETEPLGGFIAGTYVQLLELVSLCTAVVFVSNGGALSLSRGQLKRREESWEEDQSGTHERGREPRSVRLQF